MARSPNRRHRHTRRQQLPAWLAALAGVLLAQGSAAQDILANRFYSNIAGGTQVTAGTTLTGRIDLGPERVISSGTLIVNLSDDNDAPVLLGGNVSGPVNMSGGDESVRYEPGNYIDTFNTYHTRLFSDPGETARLRVGGVSASAASPSFEYVVHNFTLFDRMVPQDIYVSDGVNEGYAHILNMYWSVYQSKYAGHKGSFSLALNLDAAAVDDINAEGVLDFRLDAELPDSDFRVDNAYLQAAWEPRTHVVIINPPPVVIVTPGLPPTAIVTVPEPGTLVLASAGLCAVAFVQRRRRQGEAVTGTAGAPGGH